jgi:hypothetical protein
MNRLLCIIFFVGCERACENNIKFLTNCDYKYWDLVYYRNDSGLVGSYRISSDGSCYYLKYYYDRHERDFFNDGDIVEINSWHFLPNDSLNLMGGIYSVILLTSDSLVVYLPTIRDTQVLVASCDQNDKYKFPSSH